MPSAFPYWLKLGDSLVKVVKVGVRRIFKYFWFARTVLGSSFGWKHWGKQGRFRIILDFHLCNGLENFLRGQRRRWLLVRGLKGCDADLRVLLMWIELLELLRGSFTNAPFFCCFLFFVDLSENLTRAPLSWGHVFYFALKTRILLMHHIHPFQVVLAFLLSAHNPLFLSNIFCPSC